MYDYVIDKYGDAANNVNYYESTEVKDSSGRLIYPPGVVVAPNFTIQNPDDPFQTISPIRGITNFEYETNRNDKKREIYILRPSYLNQFLNDMRDISKYGFNYEYVNSNTIRAANTKNTSP